MRKFTWYVLFLALFFSVPVAAVSWIVNGDFEDTSSSVWEYYESDGSFTGSYHYFNGSYGFHMDYIGCCGDGRTTAYNLGFPSGTTGNAGTYNQITQNVTVPSGLDYTLSFVVRDSYYGGYIAQVFHWKQVYIDGVKVWEDDVYMQEGCQYVELNVTSHLSGKSTVNLTLRHYIHAGFSSHGVSVYWDNVTLLTSKPSRIQNGLFESSDYWKNTSDGNFTGQYNTSGANHEATEGVYDGKRSYEIGTNGTNTQGKYYSVNQAIKVPIVAESDPYRIRFWVKDDYTGSTANNYFKELLVDGRVVWRDDVKGSEASGDIPRGWNGWMLVNENVESNLRGKSTADISLRVYANSTTTFNVTVWFDAVEVYTGIDYWNRRLDNTRGALGGYAYYVSWNQYNMVGNNWNTFFHYISRDKWRWDTFTQFVNSSKGQMRVFACILPLSDEFGSPTGGSYPYRKNYLDWPKHIANMSKKYPNLKGMYIDDFGFEKHHVMQMMKNGRAINPTFTLLPNQYYYVAAETRMEDLGTSLDGSSWCYRGLSGYGKSDASHLKNETLLTKKAYGEKLLIGHPYTTFVQDFNGTSYEQEQTYLWGDGSTPYILNGGIHLNAAGNLYRRVGEYKSTVVGNGDFESTANWSNKITNANFNIVYSSSIYLGGSNSLHMSFPASTALTIDNYVEISQLVTLPLNSSRYRITGWVRDDYNQLSNKGYWFKQIAVDGEVIWEDDVEDFESNVSGEKHPRWGWFNEDFTRYADETVNLTFRLYLKNNITDFDVNVWWDNITLLQTKTGLDNGDMESTNATARTTMWRFTDSKRYGKAYGSGAYGTHYYVGAFVDTDSNFTGNFTTEEKHGGSYSYKTTITTIANNTDYAEISQVINIPLLTETWLNFSVKDNTTTGKNNYTKEAIICYLNTTYQEDCKTLWSDDVDGNEGWQKISVRIDNHTSRGNRTTVEIRLRTTAQTNPSFSTTTYWDDISLDVCLKDEFQLEITIKSPQDTQYAQNWIWANISLNEDGIWCRYSLNGNPNEMMDGSNRDWHKKVSGLTQGQHNIRFSCNDTLGYIKHSRLRYFEIVECTLDGDCNSTQYCNNSNKCEDKKGNGAYCNTDGGCISGYCCHNTCRPTCPYCGDGHCDIGEDHDNCPSDCTTTTPPTTTTTTPTTTTTIAGGGNGGNGGGGGSGGGGGFSALPSTKATCFDGLKNCHEDGTCEEDIDCGGPCEPCPSCTDKILNQGEEGIDCGGPCGPCETPASCFDGIQNQGEEGIDCGGLCKPCPTCTDGIQNQGETGIDCGGPCTPCEEKILALKEDITINIQIPDEITTGQLYPVNVTIENTGDTTLNNLKIKIGDQIRTINLDPTEKTIRTFHITASEKEGEYAIKVEVYTNTMHKEKEKKFRVTETSLILRAIEVDGVLYITTKSNTVDATIHLEATKNKKTIYLDILDTKEHVTEIPAGNYIIKADLKKHNKVINTKTVKPVTEKTHTPTNLNMYLLTPLAIIDTALLIEILANITRRRKHHTHPTLK